MRARSPSDPTQFPRARGTPPLTRRSPAPLPAVVAFPGEAARQAGWGRLLDLSASSAVLATFTPLSRLEQVLLSFELGEERFEAVAARVACARTDEDGYTRAELFFVDETERRRLSRVLLDLLSRFC